MSVIRPVLTGAAVLVAAALSAGIGIVATPHTAHAAPVVQASTKTKTKKALDKYRASYAPSRAWRHASAKDRKQAKRAYLAEFGSWENGCLADLKHAYQGKTGKGGMRYVQPYLPVIRQSVPGRDIYLGYYVDGVCGENA